MIVKDNPDLEHVAVSFYQASEDKAIRYQCEARQLWLEEQAAREKYHENIRKKYETAIEQLAEKDEQLVKKEEQLAEKDEQLARMREELESLRQAIAVGTLNDELS